MDRALTEPRILRLQRLALWLGILTVIYNLLEGLVSVAFGAGGEALTLLGFGLDSFVEVLSALGIVAMLLRIRRSPQEPASRFERAALCLTGAGFFLLVAGLLATAVFDLATRHRPGSSLPGLVISLISIACMTALLAAKRRVGLALGSAPILADAECSRVCIYMSLVLLAASLVYRLTGFGFVDSLGALGLIWFSMREGREAFEKARSLES